VLEVVTGAIDEAHNSDSVVER